MDVVALGEDLGGEGALFGRGEEGEVGKEGVDVSEDGVRERRLFSAVGGGGAFGGGYAGEVGFD